MVKVLKKNFEVNTSGPEIVIAEIIQLIQLILPANLIESHYRLDLPVFMLYKGP
jgi:hypothetical protein